MSVLSYITFMEVALSLIAVGIIERIAIQYLPEGMVGPNGWLLTTSE